MLSKEISFIAAGRICENEIEIHFGNETYTTIPITFRENVTENSSEELSLKNEGERRKFEMEWVVLS